MGREQRPLLNTKDLEYFALTEAYSRHDRENEDKIKQLFLDNKQYFQMAYSIENKVLVTHAGVTLPWYCLMFKDGVKKFVLQDLISVDMQRIILNLLKQRIHIIGNQLKLILKIGLIII